jgi:hypothetical protein
MVSIAARIAEAIGRPQGDKNVTCTHCGHSLDVARRAMSTFCPNCRKRLILEDFKVDSYYAVRDFSTSGDIVVEKKGHVVAPIKAANLTVKGKVQGLVQAQGEVKLTKTGYLKGEIAARSLCVEAGGVLDAFLRIGIVDPVPTVGDELA